MPAVNPDVAAAIDPPIAEAQSWIAGRRFPADRPLLDLAQAVPSYPPAPALLDHLADRLRRFETAQYTPIAGLPALRERLAAHMAACYGGAIAADNVLIAAGCNQAYCLAIMALARAGDEVILPTPYYFNHQMWLDMLGIRARHLRFRADRAGVPDPEDARALITGRTRAIVLVTPNNPTGAVYPPAALERFRALAAETGIALILDETYKDFLPAGEPPHHLFADPDWTGNLVQLYSFSKVFSLTGYRVGAVIAAPALIAAITKIMDTIAICAPRIGQDAALFGLDRLADWVDGKRAMLAGRREALQRAFAGNAPGYQLVASGACFAYLRHPFAGVPAMAVAKRLADDHNILCLPGSMFGPGQDDCLRLAFANAEAAEMPALAARLRASLDGHP